MQKTGKYSETLSRSELACRWRTFVFILWDNFCRHVFLLGLPKPLFPMAHRTKCAFSRFELKDLTFGIIHISRFRLHRASPALPPKRQFMLYCLLQRIRSGSSSLVLVPSALSFIKFVLTCKSKTQIPPFHEGSKEKVFRNGN